MKIKGTVKWYSGRKGYGFITGDDGVDYFMHYTNLHGNANRNKHNVIFRPGTSDKGSIALDIKYI